MKRGDQVTILPSAPGIEARHHMRTGVITRVIRKQKGKSQRYEMICQEATLTISEEHLGPMPTGW